MGSFSTVFFSFALIVSLTIASALGCVLLKYLLPFFNSIRRRVLLVARGVHLSLGMGCDWTLLLSASLLSPNVFGATLP